jgi:hypothetical protein
MFMLWLSPLTRPPLRSGDLSPWGRGKRRPQRQPSLLPAGEKVDAKRPDEGDGHPTAGSAPS